MRIYVYQNVKRVGGGYDGYKFACICFPKNPGPLFFQIWEILFFVFHAALLLDHFT